MFSKDGQMKETSKQVLSIQKFRNFALYVVNIGQFKQLLKTRVILILNFTRPYSISHTNCGATRRHCFIRN